MNRSIFQIWFKYFSGIKVFTFIISTFILFFFIKYNINVNCANFKCSSNLSNYVLTELFHNNIKFYKANCISEYNSKIALDLFLEYKTNNNLNYKLSKYFLNKNGFLIPFDKKSSYSHPNLYLGNFNNILFNYQFSHNNKFANFQPFTVNDIIRSGKPQYFSNTLYMYSNNLSQVMLNHNDLNLNQQYINLNESLIKENERYSLKAQNYLDFNKNKLDDFINYSLNN